MKVFTFWEPAGRVPGYISACMRTWKNIPDADIVLLDFSTIGQYLDAEVLRRLTCDKLSLPKQVDAYRAALLEKWGGMWLDVDMIVTPNISEPLFFDRSVEVTVFSQPMPDERVSIAGAFFFAREPHTRFMREWLDVLPERVARYARFRSNPLLRVFKRKVWRECRAWDYCLNLIVDPLVSTMRPEELRVLPLGEIGAFLELSDGKIPMAEYWAAYNNYYFQPGAVEGALDRCKGIVMLHNSWTPPEFMAMSERDFLRSGCRLSRILAELGVS